MKKILKISTTLSSFGAFYQLLLLFRHLAYGQLDGLLDPILPGLMFTALALASNLLGQIKAKPFVSPNQSVA